MDDGLQILVYGLLGFVSRIIRSRRSLLSSIHDRVLRRCLPTEAKVFSAKDTDQENIYLRRSLQLLVLFGHSDRGCHYWQFTNNNNCLSVYLSVTDKLQIDSSSLFLDEIEPFLVVSSPWPPLQTLFLDFWLTPFNVRNLLPKICTKSPISRLVWQIDRRCFHLPGSFRGLAIQCNHIQENAAYATVSARQGCHLAIRLK